MRNFFLVKAKFETTSENGSIQKKSESYLVDALSFSEAENRVIEEMTPFISGEFSIKNINPQKISEIFFFDDCEMWFKCRINILTLNENGVEKKTPHNYLVQADNISDARINLGNSLKCSMQDYTVESISDAKITEVLIYNTK